MLLVAPDDQAISALLERELAEVEKRFALELRSDLPCVNTLVRHIESYRGKMLRPMLVLVTGMATAEDQSKVTDAHRTLAAVVEMVHMATLVHDDVLDEAEVRRGGETINHLRGNETAVMLGDYLISHAYHLCCSIEPTSIASQVARATNQVCEGELHQLANRENWDLDEETYFQIIRGKTACLCGSCCELAATLNDADPQVAKAMNTYGEKLGLAFQIVDDVLDLTGSEDTVGKTLGLDLAKGKLTLPLIHCLANAEEPRRQAVRSILESGGAKPDEADQLRQWLIEQGSVRYATDTARKLVNEAKAALDLLPASPPQKLLAAMADAVLTRKF